MTSRTSVIRTGVLCLLLALASAGCGPEPVERVPDWLLGIWKTDAPRYQNRFLEVRPGEIVFGVAGMELDRHAIERMDRSDAEDGGTTWRLHYEADEGYADVLVLHVEPGLQGLRVGARAGRWMRASWR